MKILIYQKRIDKNLKIEELAKRSGIARTTLWRLETEKNSPTILQLKKIAKALNLRISDLFEDELK